MTSFFTWQGRGRNVPVLFLFCKRCLTIWIGDIEFTKTIVE